MIQNSVNNKLKSKTNKVMTNKQFDTRTNSLPDYLRYLMDLAPIKFEQVTTGEATMAEYNQLTFIIKDLCDVCNDQPIAIDYLEENTDNNIDELLNPKNK